MTQEKALSAKDMETLRAFALRAANELIPASYKHGVLKGQPCTPDTVFSAPAP